MRTWATPGLEPTPQPIYHHLMLVTMTENFYLSVVTDMPEVACSEKAVGDHEDRSRDDHQF